MITETNSGNAAKYVASQRQIGGRAAGQRLFQLQHEPVNANLATATSLASARVLRPGHGRSMGSGPHSFGKRQRSARGITAPRQLTPKDRDYLRAVRAAEMSLWQEIRAAEPVQEVVVSKPSVGALFTKLADPDQKREFALLVILATAATIAVGVAFIQSGSFLQSWAEFVQNVRGF
jgi:hypothetical protein